MMNTVTIAWIAFPFFLGFVVFLLPKLDRYLAMLSAIASAAYAVLLFVNPSTLTLQLIDNFGVTLVVDRLTGYFVLTNALVTAAALLYCWQSDKNAFFYAQTIIVHGSVNAAFACADFVSLYVALEVSGIAAFLLIAYRLGITARTVGRAFQWQHSSHSQYSGGNQSGFGFLGNYSSFYSLSRTVVTVQVLCRQPSVKWSRVYA
jgi:formate hydrogenlyase subunit 3/multisubunit Na+/H+ antiporter MnhD subunit